MGKRFIPFLLFSLMGTSLQAMDCEWTSQLVINSDSKIDVLDEDYLEEEILRKEYDQSLKKIGAYTVCINEQLENILSDLATESTNGENRYQLILKLEQKIEDKVEDLYKANKKLSQNLLKLEKQHSQFKKEVKSSDEAINNLIENLTLTHETRMKSIEEVDEELKLKLEETTNQINELSARLADSDSKIDNGLVNINNTLSDKTLYGIISILTITLLVILLFMLLKNTIFKQRTDLKSDLESMKKNIDEESIKLDNKLINLIEAQISIDGSKEASSDQIDHSLALKVADEIVRIQKNTLQMDTKTKGLKQLVASVKRIQDNFSSNGYDIVEMLNQPYDEGMKVSANFIPDEDLDENEQIITRIIKPQVNYQGEMIQAAQIEVSIGE